MKGEEETMWNHPNLKEEVSKRRETDLFGGFDRKIRVLSLILSDSFERSFVVASFTVNISVRLLVYFGF